MALVDCLNGKVNAASAVFYLHASSQLHGAN